MAMAMGPRPAMTRREQPPKPRAPSRMRSHRPQRIPTVRHSAPRAARHGTSHVNGVWVAARPAAEVHPRVGVQVQLGGKGLGVAVKVERLLHQEAKLPGQLDPRALRHVRHLEGKAGDRLVVHQQSGAQGAVGAHGGCHLGVEGADAPGEGLDVRGEARAVHLLLRGAHVHEGVRHGGVVLAHERGPERLHRTPRLWRDAPHDAKVEEAHAAVLEHEEVARVHVRVEEGARDHGQGPRVERVDQRLFRVCRVVANPLDVSEGHAVEARHGEHAGARSGLHGHGAGGHAREARGLQEGPELPQMLGLLPEVQLAEHGLPQVARDVSEGESGEVGGEGLQEARGHLEEAQIRLEHVRCPGLLHLDHHLLPAAPQPRGVHLRHGGGRERRGIDGREHLVGRLAQVRLHDALDHLEGHRGGAVEALFELEHVLRREERGRGGDELPQLDVRCPQSLKELPERAGREVGGQGGEVGLHGGLQGGAGRGRLAPGQLLRELQSRLEQGALPHERAPHR
mmetsp:Transcript_20901/g.70171  ORF Transcript_20901/g.70171 Transcript_20901/m.70171 type:complete len:511 (-) Transcript_20901:146-1678(-)